MKNILNFEKWYTKLGGKIPINEKLNFEALNQVELKVSSFKNRAKEVKEIYNYKFADN